MSKWTAAPATRWRIRHRGETGAAVPEIRGLRHHGRHVRQTWTPAEAFRVISTEESRDLAAVYAPLEPDKVQQQVQAYKIMPDSVMFRVQEVKVDLTPYDLPGPTRRKVTCSQCGQVVRDHREMENKWADTVQTLRWRGLFYRVQRNYLPRHELVALYQQEATES